MPGRGTSRWEGWRRATGCSSPSWKRKCGTAEPASREEGAAPAGALSCLDDLHLVAVGIFDQQRLAIPEPVLRERDDPRRDEGDASVAQTEGGRVGVARDERRLPVDLIVGAGLRGVGPAVARGQVFKELDAGPGGGPEARDPQASSEDVVQMLLLGAVVLALPRHLQPEQVAVEP